MTAPTSTTSAAGSLAWWATTSPATPTRTSPPVAVIDRFCLRGPPAAHVERLQELREIGLQFALYLPHDAKESTPEAYGETIVATPSGPRLLRN